MTRGGILATGAVTFTLLAVVCIKNHLPQVPGHSFLTTATFHARIEPGTLTLRGSLPSQSSKDHMLQAAQEFSGPAKLRVIDELTVDSHIETAPWLDAVPSILPALGHMSERGSIIIDGRSLVLSGRAKNPAAKTALLRTITPATAAGLAVEDHVLATLSSTPAASKSPLQININKILARASIEFDSNSATITSQGEATLDKLLIVLRQSPKLPIEIGGHTDSYGEPDYNLQLSQRRADAVRRYFIQHGVTNPLTAVGYGATHPLSKETHRQGLQRNRRIELHVKGSGDL